MDQKAQKSNMAAISRLFLDRKIGKIKIFQIPASLR